ncbi:MAG: DNA repair protein RadC [Mollicutes bacterium]|nr:MAG: DNA repair protein RadC [Mollicutes bacterium]
MNFKNLPSSAKPREKALKQGFRALTDIELLALFLRTGSREHSVLMLAQKLIESAGGFVKIADLSNQQLKEVKGIGSAKALELKGTFELVRRIKNLQAIDTKIKISKPEEICDLLSYEYEDLQNEHFYLVLLNSRNEVINKKQLYQGTNQQLSIDLRDIFSYALSNNARKIICVHNHPSGNPLPSIADKKTTKEIYEIGNKMNVPLVDHIILGKNKFHSILLKKTFIYKTN